MLKHREILGDLHRIVRGDQRGRRGQDDPFGPRRDEGEQGRRRGGHERRVVVLAGGEDVKADFLRLRCDGRHHLQSSLLGGRLSGDGIGLDITDGENAELHLTRFFQRFRFPAGPRRAQVRRARAAE